MFGLHAVRDTYPTGITEIVPGHEQQLAQFRLFAVFPVETETETETETESSTQTETEGSSEPESSTETETETETKTETETESSTPAYEDLKITVAEIPDAVYTGKAVKPEIKVYNNNRLLEINKDYSVSYKNNTNAGTATVTVKGKGNLKDSKTVTFKIHPKDLSSGDVITEDLAVAYNKKLQKKLPSVTYNGKKLKAKDYTVTKGEGDFTAPGTYTVTFAGKGNYTGTATGKLIITDKSKIISSAKTGKIPEQTYGGKPVTPDFTVTLSGKILAKDRDYTVSYVSNNAPGKATAVIKGCGEYAGTKTVSFNIKKGITSLTGSMVSVADSMVYDRQGCTPEPVVTDAGYVLVKGTDYTVSYKNNKKTGTASVTVKGKGSYAGSVTKTFTIRQADIADTVMRVPDIVYTGKAGKYVSKPVLMDANGNILSLNKDYANIIYMADGKVLGKKANPEYGTVITVTVTGKGNYKGTATATYTLKGTSFAKAKVNGNITKTYTGKRIKIKPSDLKVTLNGKLLSYGTDYEIVEGTYRNNIKKGTASVVIRGLGDYAGEKTVKFKITAKSIR